MNHSAILMVIIWALWFLSTPFDYFLDELPFYTTYNYTLAFISTLLVFAWYLVDTKGIGVQSSKKLNIGVLLIPIIFIPYYLVKYKGWKRSVISFSKFAGLLALLIAYSELINYYYSYEAQ